MSAGEMHPSCLGHERSELRLAGQTACLAAMALPKRVMSVSVGALFRSKPRNSLCVQLTHASKS